MVISYTHHHVKKSSCTCSTTGGENHVYHCIPVSIGTRNWKVFVSQKFIRFQSLNFAINNVAYAYFRVIFVKCKSTQWSNLISTVNGCYNFILYIFVEPTFYVLIFAGTDNILNRNKIFLISRECNFFTTICLGNYFRIFLICIKN